MMAPSKVHSVANMSLSAVCCLLSAVCCLLSAVCCLLSAVCCLLSAVCCLLSAVCCLLSAVCCLLSAVCCLLSAICYQNASHLLQVSFFGSGALHPMWLRNFCKAACTAKPFRCHPAMVSSKTSLRLLLSMPPRLLLADHQLPDASQVQDLACSSCSSHLYSPTQHVLHGACDDRTTCVLLCHDYLCSGCVVGWPCMP